MIDGAGTALGTRAADLLRSLGRVRIGRGLTAAEFDRVERRFGFTFADDHRAFLAAGLPTGDGWPDWRHRTDAALRHRLDWPVEGTLFDVEHNGFWYGAWGARPEPTGEALAVARQRLAAVPRMVPVFGHRYLPAGRGTYGHPVLSMYQTDIIVYGADLVDYLRHEFRDGDADGTVPDCPVTVPFWRDLVG